MSNSDQLIAITIYGRTYQIKCPPEEAAQLRGSADYLDSQMKKMSQSSQSNNVERLAVVAALNVTRELMTFKNQNNNYMDMMHEQIKSLQHRIQKFIGSKEEMTV
ncbi:MAG: cell division protein ZapA [Gammaproteobacteria bacterium]|nr:cell division protein ZapA [Gammaproteobacteria bacterium]